MGVDRLPDADRRNTPRLHGGRVPIGSLTGGLLNWLERTGGHGWVADHRGPRVGAAEFADTVQRAAAGLGRRGLRPNDVVAVLAPVCVDRLVSVYTAMAVGGVALPLELTCDLDTLAGVLNTTDARLILTTAELAPVALELSERSRVRQVISFGDVPETTPFTDLLVPDRHSGYDPAHGLFDSGLIGYSTIPGAVPHVAVHPYRALAEHFRHLDVELRLSWHDTVVVEDDMTEFDRCVLASVALWNGASVLALPAGEEAARAALRSHPVTVRGAPLPTRITPDTG